MAMKLGALDRICIGVVVAVVSLSAVASVAVNARLRRSVAAGNASVEAKLAQLSQAQSTLAEMRSVIAGVRSDIRKIDLLVPPAGRMGSFLAELDARVAARGIIMANLEPGQPVAETPYVRIPVTLSVRGRFADIYGFLYDLERMDRLVDMSRLELSRSGSGGVCSARIELNLYERGSAGRGGT